MNYTLEFLEDKFQQHSKEFKKNLSKYKKRRKENGWGLPNYDEDFSLPDALLLIIQEIKTLKDK